MGKKEEVKQESVEQNIENEDKKDKTEKVQDNKESKVKKSKKKGIIITIIILIILLVLGIGGYFLYKYNKLKSPIDVAWGETYYAYLKSGTIDGTKTKEEIGFEDGMENTKLEFAQVEDEENPVMIVSYDKQDESYNNIYKIKDNEVTYTKIEEPSDIELLYNVEEKLFHLYVHTENDKEDKYEPVNNLINNEESEQLPVYSIEKEEETADDTISEFNLTFIKPEVEENKKYDFSTDISEEEMKEIIQNAVNDYKDLNSIITDEVKNEISKTPIGVSKIDNTKDWVYTAYEKTYNYDDGFDSVNVKVPAINIDTEEIKELNSEILSKYKKYDEGNAEVPNYEIYYRFYENEDIVTVIINSNIVMTTIPKYDIYNVNTVTGEILDNEDILKLKNITVEDYEKNVKTILDNEFTEGKSSLSGTSFYKEQREKNRSDKNCSVENTKIFLGVNGELQFVANLYSLAGADKYEKIFDYTTTDTKQERSIENGKYNMDLTSSDISLAEGDVYLEIEDNNIKIYNNFAQIEQEGTFEVKDNKIVGTYTKATYLDHQKGGMATEKSINDKLEFEILEDGSLQDNLGFGKSVSNNLFKGRTYSK